VISYCN